MRNIILLIFLGLCCNISFASKSAILSPIETKYPVKYNQNKGLIDTLFPVWEGPSYVGWQAPYRKEYEATKLTPAGPCSIITITHGVGSFTAGVSKECSVFIWNDISGMPGARLYQKRVTAIAETAQKVQFNWYNINPPVYVSGPFWVGNYEWDTLFPTSAVDSTPTIGSTKYDSGTGWLPDVGDYYHGAVVKYIQTGEPDISVTPAELILNIDSSIIKSIPILPAQISPINEDDEQYWTDIVPGEIIIGYNNTINAQTASLKDLGLLTKEITLLNRNLGDNLILIKLEGTLQEEKTFLKTMKTKSNVKSIEPNRIFKPFATPNDTYWSNQWDKRSLNADDAWDHGWGDFAVCIAIIDQGTDYNHVDLKDRYGSVKGYDYMDNDADPMYTSSAEQHGTHCSGVAAATINNSTGIAGMSNSHLYSLRFMNADSGKTSGILNSIQWCINNQVKILSMSNGTPNYSATLDARCTSAWNAGCILFAATGNNGAEVTMYPAGFGAVLAIGAIDQSNSRASFSNYGNYMKFVAPGVTIPGTLPGNNYANWDGTSMACPEVAGGAALVWAANPSLTNTELRDILINTAVDISPTGWDKYTGYGKPDFGAAVDAALNMTPTPADTGMITVYNNSSATGNLYVTDITRKESWIKSITPTSFSVAPGSSQGVTIIVEAKLHTGYYYDTLKIESNDTTKTPYSVPITLRVGDVGIEEYSTNVFDFKLSPNPVSKSLFVSFNTPASHFTTLKIYDITGRVVKTILNGLASSGNHSLKINTTDLSSGIYFVSLKTGTSQTSKKITLIR